MEKQQLVIGQTILDTINASTRDGTTLQTPLYYGNIIIQDDKVFHIDSVLYQRKVRDFLATNPDFERYSEEKIRADENLAKNFTVAPVAPETPITQEIESLPQSYSESTVENAEVRAENQSFTTNPEPVREVSNVYREPAYNNNFNNNDEDEMSDEEFEIETLKKKNLLFKIICAGLALLLALACFFLVKSVAKVDDSIKVVQINKTLSIGEEITEEDITPILVAPEVYEEMSGLPYLASDGSTRQSVLVLWEDKDSVVGKYVTNNLLNGSYLSTADYGNFANEEGFMNIEVDETVVRVPISYSPTADATIAMYAVVTSEIDGEMTTVALPLGSFLMEGQSLIDALNTDGKSMIQQMLPGYEFPTASAEPEVTEPVEQVEEAKEDTQESEDDEGEEVKEENTTEEAETQENSDENDSDSSGE